MEKMSLAARVRAVVEDIINAGPDAIYQPDPDLLVSIAKACEGAGRDADQLANTPFLQPAVRDALHKLAAALADRKEEA